MESGYEWVFFSKKKIQIMEFFFEGSDLRFELAEYLSKKKRKKKEIWSWHKKYESYFHVVYPTISSLLTPDRGQNGNDCSFWKLNPAFSPKRWSLWSLKHKFSVALYIISCCKRPFAFAQLNPQTSSASQIYKGISGMEMCLIFFAKGSAFDSLSCDASC